MVKNFLKVQCKECNNEQNIFGYAKSIVKCVVCKNVLAKPTGGKAKLEKAELKEELEC
ncbi:30S ribosomal protein S27e [Candidatus Woesearchaeota archaeon]|jgi:small subunit ribosomal protein S27e|nr:30S ribosomal protein S27e [Candidatus Woesearchaeota archaeon]MBT4387799.1 30S ribosomal protein S27e [Candidatus Woesearchaeota archaeon]MBT4595618.1 30S ribosomal protein S27e [Candidatus Woesearchaeota archaeon]MBT5740899.1 30S ribosomal protein S27e [Candidatus Woesearchaeota archaeon]MBT6505196.1 30S ribosomal protein S27e [Candidatus Woesearchaeota archaeon]